MRHIKFNPNGSLTLPPDMFSIKSATNQAYFSKLDEHRIVVSPMPISFAHTDCKCNTCKFMCRGKDDAWCKEDMEQFGFNEGCCRYEEMKDD